MAARDPGSTELEGRLAYASDAQALQRHCYRRHTPECWGERRATNRKSFLYAKPTFKFSK